MSEDNVMTHGSEGGEMGVIQRIINVFTSPEKTFESIRRKPAWVAPFIILIDFTGHLFFDLAHHLKPGNDG